MNLVHSIRRAAQCRIPLPVPIPVPQKRMPRVMLGALMTLAMATAGFAQAAPAWNVNPNVPISTRSQIEGQLVDVQVLVDGSAAPLYVRPGAWDRSYFQAFKGRNYSLVLTNQTNQRVGVVMAVDGLNVVNGQRSSLSNREAMYVLDPYESTTIRGWRTSLKDVRRFVFVDEERSYASRTNQANGDMGWIRVLSFREQTHRTWRNGPKVRTDEDWLGERRREGDAKSMPAPSMGNDMRSQAGESFRGESEAPGTGWGERKWDPVRQTQFLAVANPSDHIVLRYEYASGLRALGIRIRDRRVFERERGEMGFAQPPRW